MAVACRQVISNLWASGLAGSANASLLLDRYLQISVKDSDHPDSKKLLYKKVNEALSSSAPLYQEFYSKWLQPRQSLLYREGNFGVRNRLIIGLGGENVLETGLTLHRINGVPYIPGTALKGLAAHYCHQVLGIAGKNSDYCTGHKYHKAIFGTTDDSGHFIFHDGFITPDSITDCLNYDIMTPHHMEYYDPGKNTTSPPTDFDEPNPVLFLSVTGVFHIKVSCDLTGNDAEKWTNLVFTILTRALAELGIGGKTNAGYGRMDLISEPSVPEKHPQEHKPGEKRYQAGIVVPVTRGIDPNTKKNRPYFIADDGVSGPLQGVILSDDQLNAITHLKIKDSPVGGGYLFILP